MNNSVFGKSMENSRKHRNIKTCNSRKKKKLFGIRTKLSHYKAFPRNLLAIKMEKTQELINKPVYLRLSIKLSKAE